MDRVVPRYRRVAHGCHIPFGRVIHAVIGVSVGEDKVFYSDLVLGAASAILCTEIGLGPNSRVQATILVGYTQHRTAPPCLLRSPVAE